MRRQAQPAAVNRVVGHGMRCSRLAGLAALGTALLAASLGASGALAQSVPVRVFPIPGSRVVNPHAQIAFRGINPLELTGITVTGSRSGGHGGKVAGDSDERGGSFLPGSPFQPGETVTVKTTAEPARSEKRHVQVHGRDALQSDSLPRGPNRAQGSE